MSIASNQAQSMLRLQSDDLFVVKHFSDFSKKKNRLG